MAELKQKVIWIDLDNSPHVLFFDPIIKELQDKGLQVLITAREYAQVIQLAELFNLNFIKIGRHYGKNKFLKTLGLIIRSIQLIPIVVRNKPLLALSHGSRSQVLTARILRIKCATAYDYEPAHGIPFIKPDIKLLPDIIPESRIHRNAKIYIKYPGIKEDVYIHKFVPNPEIINKLKLDQKKVIVTLRPPAYSAHYFSEKSREIFNETIDYLANIDKTQVVITPRTDDQKAEIINRWREKIESGKFIIPVSAVNGLNLIWHSDLVISGGGTMIREAAALRVPAYSIFESEIGSVDKFLAESGRLSLIRDKKDIKEKIKIEKHIKNNVSLQKNKLTLNFICNAIVDLLSEQENGKIIDKAKTILNKQLFIIIPLFLYLWANYVEPYCNCF